VDDANSITQDSKADITTFREALPSRVNNEDSRNRDHHAAAATSADVSAVAQSILVTITSCIPMRYEHGRNTRP
jgi:hypothetical protein